MTVTQAQAQMLATLARASRPNGARSWDTGGLMAWLEAHRHWSVGEVMVMVGNAAMNADCETPAGIERFGRTGSSAPFTPQIVAPENRCGICSKDRDRCPRERVADDDHVFDDGQRVPVDVHRTVAALKDVAREHVAPRPMPKTLDDRLAAIPAEKRDPGITHVRQQLAKETA